MNKIVKAIKNPRQIFIHLVWNLQIRGFFDSWDDEYYLKFIYWLNHGKKLNLDKPKTFNEKLQWLKLNDRNLNYTIMVDKYKVKEYVANIIGSEYIIPTLGVWEQFDDIDFELLPNQFVLKCTHDSGGVVICKNKNKLDINQARKIIEKSLNTNYYLYGREWPYKNVKPRIIAEVFMSNENKTSDELSDYKVHCFNGEPKLILVCTERHAKSGLKEDFYNIEWRHLDMARPKHLNSAKRQKKPKNYQKMLKISKILANNIPFSRIDFYEVEGKLYFGEITLYPASGLSGFIPKEWDTILGDWIEL